MRAILLRALPLAALLIAGSAHAQLISPIRYNEGPGIKLSDSVLFHPGVWVGGGYDSNINYANTFDGKPIIGVGYLRVVPHLALATSSAQRLEDADGKTYRPTIFLRLDAALSFREYFIQDGDIKTYKQIGVDLESWRHVFEVTGNLDFRLFPGRLFSLEIFDQFTRSVAPLPGNVQNGRDINRGGLKFVLAPGGGLLSFGLGYAFNLDYFESDTYAAFRKMAHEVMFEAKWKILPKSAVFLDVNWQYHDYYEGVTTANRTNSMPLRIFLGYNGLFTPRFGVLLKVGYGGSFHETFDSYNMLVATLELNYYIGPMAKLSAGFQHDFNDSLITNYYMDERIYLRYDHLIINRIMIHLEGDYRYRSHGGLSTAQEAANMQAPRNHIITGDVGLDWRIRDWINIGAGYNIQYRQLASDPIPTTELGRTTVTDYTKHQVYGKVGISY